MRRPPWETSRSTSATERRSSNRPSSAARHGERLLLPVVREELRRADRLDAAGEGLLARVGCRRRRRRSRPSRRRRCRPSRRPSSAVVVAAVGAVGVGLVLFHLGEMPLRICSSVSVVVTCCLLWRGELRESHALCQPAANRGHLGFHRAFTPKATFSIWPPTGLEVGCAVQSRYFAVGSVVPWAKAGVGAVATQAAGVAVYGPQTLAFLEGGARLRRRRSSRCSPAIPRASRGSSARSRPTGARRPSPGPSVSRGRATGRATATPSRGTSSRARRWWSRWSAHSSRRAARSRSGWCRRSRPARRRAATRAGSSPRRSSSSAWAQRPSRARGSTACASCGSRITRRRSPSSGGCSGSIRLGRAAAGDACSTRPGSTREGAAILRAASRRRARMPCSSTTSRASSRWRATPRRRSGTSRARWSSMQG